MPDHPEQQRILPGGHLIDAPVSTVSSAATAGISRLAGQWLKMRKKIDARAGFIVHPVNLETLVEYYFPSFEAYAGRPEQVFNWWNGISRFLEPVHVKNEYVTSNEFTIEINLVFVPYLPAYINTHKNDWRSGQGNARQGPGCGQCCSGIGG